ncbi:YitT family protein [Evansella sp. AB-rgal1]|uniref:YitT family protein n=1 Tax=Evansella sp. AB-rgal1 TaxID=3242696 RepID=UPI00359D6A26
MKKFVEQYTNISIAAIIQGIAMALFLFPNSIPSGGAGGLAVLLNYWFSIPLSLALWFVNFSMLVIAIYWLGNASALGTMYGISITSLTIFFFESKLYELSSPFTIWIDFIIGSIILGIGVGILLRHDVSNGGMGVLALIYSKYRDVPPGKPLLLINGCIFILTGSIIDWRIVILAIISQWISTRVVDIIHQIKITTAASDNLPTMAWYKK